VVTDLDLPGAERLAKLIRLLSSDRSGEVGAAVEAIKRTLETCGLDLHDLADRLTGKRERGLTKAELERAERDAYCAGFRDGLADADDMSWNQMAKFCLARAERLDEREQDFVEQMVR
jgi:hypothetical protein